MSTMLAIFPDQDMVIVVLANLGQVNDSELELVQTIAKNFAQWMLSKILLKDIVKL